MNTQSEDTDEYDFIGEGRVSEANIAELDRTPKMSLDDLRQELEGLIVTEDIETYLGGGAINRNCTTVKLDIEESRLTAKWGYAVFVVDFIWKTAVGEHYTSHRGAKYALLLKTPEDNLIEKMANIRRKKGEKKFSVAKYFDSNKTLLRVPSFFPITRTQGTVSLGMKNQGLWDYVNRYPQLKRISKDVGIQELREYYIYNN